MQVSLPKLSSASVDALVEIEMINKPRRGPVDLCNPHMACALSSLATGAVEVGEAFASVLDCPGKQAPPGIRLSLVLLLSRIQDRHLQAT